MTKLSDFVEPIELEGSKPLPPPPVKGAIKPKSDLKHRHPKADHETIYSAVCPKCRQDDEVRRDAKEAPIPDSELDNTLFFIPNFEPDRGAAIEYLKHRYEGKAKHIAHTVPLPTILSMPQIQIVLCRRVARPGKELHPIYKDVPITGNEPGTVAKTRLMSVSNTILKDDILESIPLQVQDYAVNSVFTLDGTTVHDGINLVEALSDIAGPDFRILKRNPPDVEIVFTIP